MAEIGALYKVKTKEVILSDTKTRKEQYLKKDDIVLVVDYDKISYDPIILCENYIFHLFFDYYYGEFFETFFEKIP